MSSNVIHSVRRRLVADLSGGKLVALTRLICCCQSVVVCLSSAELTLVLLRGLLRADKFRFVQVDAICGQHKCERVITKRDGNGYLASHDRHLSPLNAS